MGNSIVDLKLLSTQKKETTEQEAPQLTKKPHSDIVIRQNSPEAQTKNRASMADGNITLNNTNHSTQINGSQVDIHTGEKNIAKKMRS